jgi:pimeloyl-ACP methyl ester carboxylesterase
MTQPLGYTRTGNPNGAPVVFLHGAAMGAWMWEGQAPLFELYDCYLVDLPGHASSNGVVWQSFEQAADAVADLIRTRIAGGRAHLVAMSLGAAVGLHLLTRHPHTVERAILTGALAETPPRVLMWVQEHLLSAILPTEWGKRAFGRMIGLPADAMPPYLQTMRQLSIPSFKRTLRDLSAYALPDGLAAVQTPCLFVTGGNDLAVNVRSVRALRDRVAGSVGAYAAGLHHPWNGEDPDLFNRMTRAWLSGEPLPTELLPA